MCENTPCRICGEIRRIHAKGRCKRCYGHFIRWGKERPTEKKKKPTTCARCGIDDVYCSGHCKKCYRHRFNRGTIRTYKYKNPELPRWCKNCGSPGVNTEQRCEACAWFFKRHKRERPRHLWDETFCCKTCKLPLSTYKGWKIKGRCNPCYKYLKRTGRDRPREYWGIGVHGWCECGFPATHLIDKFPLCNRCAKEYQQPIVAVAGDAHGGRRGSVRW